MKYKITYYNDFTEQHKEEVNPERHINKDSMIVHGAEKCIQYVKDYLDVPTAELSLDEIKKEFSYGDEVIEESKAIEIQEYYNGRLAIYRRFLEDFKTSNDLIYEIPQKYNSFGIGNDHASKQNKAYISIQETTEEI